MSRLNGELDLVGLLSSRTCLLRPGKPSCHQKAKVFAKVRIFFNLPPPPSLPYKYHRTRYECTAVISVNNQTQGQPHAGVTRARKQGMQIFVALDLQLLGQVKVVKSGQVRVVKSGQTG